jgi:hypothetical protein
MWNGIWDKIKTKSVTPYKKDQKAIKHDSVELVLTMPIEVYSTFRLQLDAPDTLRSRRVSDKKEGSVNGAPAAV